MHRVIKAQSVYQDHSYGRVHSAHLQYLFLRSLDLQIQSRYPQGHPAANCAAGSVSGEDMKYLTEDAIGDDNYNKIYNTLAVFRDNVELEYVYCIKEAGPDSFIFTMDLDLHDGLGPGRSCQLRR